MFWKKKKTAPTQTSKILLGMVLLQDESSFDLDNFLKDYNNSYTDQIQELSGDNTSAAFRIAGEMVVIGHMPLPVPAGDIEGTAQYAYNWPTALEDTKSHKSHLIVSVVQGGADQVQRYKIFTQVLCSLLRSSSALGVYKGNQSLLLPKEDYLDEAGLMNEEYLPINLWVYIGLRETDNGNAGYTYGLIEFGKAEMEILNSSRSLEDIRAFLFNIAHYVLDYDITFQDGQTVGGSEEEKIAVKFSKGAFVAGDSFKLAY